MEPSGAKVVFADAKEGVRQAVEEVFSRFPQTLDLIRDRGEAWVKVNAVDLRPYCFTDPAVVVEAVRVLKDAGAKQVKVVENSTQGNITRLVARATGLFDACKEAGAEFLCLDETREATVFLPNLQRFANISLAVHDALIRDRDQRFYLSIPKLKTHSMTTMTLSVKNQFGFFHHGSRVEDHNFLLHRKIADLYSLVRPDFVLVDGLFATNHGHYPAKANIDESVVATDVILGGEDPLAVDAAGASFLGIAPESVEHLRLASQDRDNRDAPEFFVENQALFEQRRQSFTDELLHRLPEDLVILRGRERCCREGCQNNTESVAEFLHCDFKGQGGFTILMGKGVDPELVAGLKGRVHLAGTCAAADWQRELEVRLGTRNVTASLGCNNLPDTIRGLCRHMKVSPISLASVNPVTALGALVSAHLRGTRARVPKLF
ncbi:MAG: DUF362 domain-containing protein [Proteobacteria bacterium]|nr:DUF362 domain-containing protein [Pseudomonadota bacterium]